MLNSTNFTLLDSEGEMKNFALTLAVFALLVGAGARSTLADCFGYECTDDSRCRVVARDLAGLQACEVIRTCIAFHCSNWCHLVGETPCSGGNCRDAYDASTCSKLKQRVIDSFVAIVPNGESLGANPPVLKHTESTITPTACDSGSRVSARR